MDLARPLTAKLWRIMRLTAILIFIACMHAAARGHAQRISISLKDVSLKTVFIELNKQTGYNFLYSDEILAGAKKVTVDVKDATIEEVLKISLKDQPLEFSISNNTIIIKKKAADLQSAAATPVKSDTLPPIDITGRITNEHGEPMAGASVIIKRTGKGDIANADGNFKLKNVNSDDVITISFAGYKTESIKVGRISNFTIVMEVATNDLDKVVVQAYGTTTQRLATGNIGTVTAAEIERQPVMNPILALQGKIPGVIITQTNGYASSTVKIEIRGRSVIDGRTPVEPLYIIDGVPLTVLNLSSANYASGSTGFLQNGITNGPAGGQSPFFSLNSNDIESITVLKDADATAIYGSRGANGVIIINTKKGKAGKAQLNMNVYQGISNAGGKYRLLNTQQYLQMRREAFKNDQTTYGLIPGVTIPDDNNAYDLLNWDTTKYTDWQKQLWGERGEPLMPT